MIMSLHSELHNFLKKIDRRFESGVFWKKRNMATPNKVFFFQVLDWAGVPLEGSCVLRNHYHLCFMAEGMFMMLMSDLAA